VLEVIKAVEEISAKKVKVELAGRRPGDPAVLYADASLAEKLLGWEPKIVGLKDIVASAWRWHTTHPEGFED
jgi:UDP-glucose 4-epimerase